MRVDRPTFIVGPHRSGTTLVYETLAVHPDLAYYNKANRQTPCWPRTAALRTRVFGTRDVPLEAQNIWDRFLRSEVDSMSEAEATPDVIAWFRWNVAAVVRARGATRFLAKYPRLSLRLPWIDAVFPDALIIHMRRDWRAVVQSTGRRIERRRVRGGPPFGVRIPGREALEDLPVEIIGGRLFRFVTLEIEKQRERFGDRFLEVSYEDFCARPAETVREIADHCEWRWTPGFGSSIPRAFQASQAWRERLAPSVIERIRCEDPTFYARHEHDGADADDDSDGSTRSPREEPAFRLPA
jgi:hypothetical protein